MAKLRWIYLFSVDEKRRLVCEIWFTRLLKFSTFYDPEISSFKRFMRSKHFEEADPVDRKLLPLLIMKESTEGGEAILDGVDGGSIACKVIESKRAYWASGDGRRIHWQKSISVNSEWVKRESGNWLPQLTLRDQANDWMILRAQPPVAFGLDENKMTTLKSDWPDALMDEFISTLELPLSEIGRFCVRLQNRFPDHKIPIPESLKQLDGDADAVIPVIKVMRIQSESKVQGLLALNDLLCVRLQFRYGNRDVLWNDEAKTVAFHRNGQPCVLERNFDKETEYLKQLQDMGFVARCHEGGRPLDLFDFNASDYFLRPKSGGLNWETVLNEKVPELKSEGWVVIQHSDVEVALQPEEVWYDAIAERSRDWYTYEAGIKIEGIKIPVVPLLQKWLSSRPHHAVEQLVAEIDKESFAVPIGESGRALLVPGKQIGKVLRALLDRLLLKEPIGNHLKISAWRAAELAEEGIPAAQALESVNTLRRFVSAVRNRKVLKAIKPHRGFKADLRPYQQLGLGWLEFLAKNGLSGILADDMGLGKTIQVIAMLHQQKKLGNLGPVLVVCPTSVLRQWQSEVKKFASELTVAIQHGTDRISDKEKLMCHDIIMTTYGVLRQDIEFLESVAWDWVILDEAHLIKNPLSKTSRCATRLMANHRLCMTGTPVENRLSDLWSLFRFVLPGLLGDLSSFQKEFANAGHDAKGVGESPIQKMLREILRQRVAPFIIRRRKEEVLTDLPEKIEIDRLIPITDRQAEVYESYRLRLHRELAEAIEMRGVGKAQLSILEGLLRLRQICCDLRLLEGDESSSSIEDSAKLGALFEIVEESLSENRPVLVFSQFVGMLKLIEAELENRKIKYSMITGETSKREEQIRQFQEGQVDVFLISLKAGGLGLNLTRAETVIHYDPWWNPAAEAQATDRAHRIGQKNSVTMYRLITEKTIEERIITLHAAKRELAESLVSSSGNTATHRIDAAALEALLGD